jgi:hypothetical protein
LAFVKVLIQAGITLGIKVDAGDKKLAGHLVRKLLKAWTDCAIILQNIFKWSLALQNGARWL